MRMAKMYSVQKENVLLIEELRKTRNFQNIAEHG